jgi:A/G-specific adenine glycosylase
MTPPHARPANASPTEIAPADEARRAQAHSDLLAWYAATGRALPWRDTRDPYAILVSEVMLQQTQVERVLPKYQEFLALYPTLHALAAAPTADVIRAWAPLGYNVRAVRLQQIARQAIVEHGGALPLTVDGLVALKGIGRYTAGAIACFAYGLPVATVDTNIRRVLWRVFRGIEPSAWPTGQAAARATLELAAWALPATAAYDWQQALMDLGATACLSRRPRCERCPLATVCAAYAEVGTGTLFPTGDALARLRAARSTPATSPGVRTESPGRVAEERAGYAASGDTRTARTLKRTAVPFTQTTRYARGRVLAALRALEPGAALTLAELGPRLKPDWSADETRWLRDIVSGLARDGLLRLMTEADGAADVVRVALPSD